MAHTQRVPECWPAMLEASSAMVMDCQPEEAAIDDALKLHDMLGGLSGQEVEESRFYSLGILGDKFQEKIQETNVRKMVVQGAARAIVREHFPRSMRRLPSGASDEVRGVYWKKVLSYRIEYSVQPLAIELFQELPPGTRLLADTLALHAQFRQHDNLDEIRERGEREKLAGVVWFGGTAKNFSVNAFAGAAEILNCLVKSKLPKDQEDETVILDDVIDMHNLSNENFLAAALRASRMHADEFRQGLLKNYVTVSPDDSLIFHKDRVPKSPERFPVGHQDRALHDEIIGCPALYVKGLIPGALDLLLDAIRQADVLIKEGHLRNTP